MRTLLPAGWPRPKGYSNGILVPGGADLVFVAGMVGWDERGNMVSADFVEQLEQALRNVARVLAESGAAPEHVVRMTVYVTDLEAYRSRQDDVGRAWRRVMGRHYPAMSLVRVAGLLEEGALVEVEATAAVPRGSGGPEPG